MPLDGLALVIENATDPEEEALTYTFQNFEGEALIFDLGDVAQGEGGQTIGDPGLLRTPPGVEYSRRAYATDKDGAEGPPTRGPKPSWDIGPTRSYAQFFLNAIVAWLKAGSVLFTQAVTRRAAAGRWPGPTWRYRPASAPGSVRRSYSPRRRRCPEFGSSPPRGSPASRRRPKPQP